jgi:hypothetical protein
MNADINRSCDPMWRVWTEYERTLRTGLHAFEVRLPRRAPTPVSPSVLLLHDDRSQRRTDTIFETGRRRSSQAIRCPLCQWRPTSSSEWLCDPRGTPEPPFPACGAVWNTFATRGQCPGCGHQWHWTTCHRCGVCSPHADWYDVSDSDDA